MKNISGIITAIILAVLCSCNQKPVAGDDNLLEGFITPPASAKPRVWWHWMNDNITREGIHADLAWMNRGGIGGFQNFDAALMTPQIVEKRLSYMIPEWKDAFMVTWTGSDIEDFKLMST